MPEPEDEFPAGESDLGLAYAVAEEHLMRETRRAQVLSIVTDVVCALIPIRENQHQAQVVQEAFQYAGLICTEVDRRARGGK